MPGRLFLPGEKRGKENKALLRIDPEFKSLIPPLTEDELAQLEANILQDGCRDPLVVWDGVIIDGHNRYDICTRHDLPFDTKEYAFDDRDAALIWIIDNQMGRRNLTAFVRCELELRKKHIIAARAKENLKTSTGGPEPRPLSTLTKAEPLHTREEIAKAAGVSTGTVYKAEKVLEHATEEVKGKLRAGEMTINAAYLDLRDELEKKAEPKPKPKYTRVEALALPPRTGMRFAKLAIMDLEKIQPNDTERDAALQHVKEWIDEHQEA